MIYLHSTQDPGSCRAANCASHTQGGNSSRRSSRRGFFLPRCNSFAYAAPTRCTAESTTEGAVMLADLDALYPSLDALYQDLHQHPELSLQEEQTAKKMATRLRALGFDVTERVGGFGVVGLLRNGSGPT